MRDRPKQIKQEGQTENEHKRGADWVAVTEALDCNFSSPTQLPGVTFDWFVAVVACEAEMLQTNSLYNLLSDVSAVFFRYLLANNRLLSLTNSAMSHYFGTIFEITLFLSFDYGRMYFYLPLTL